MFRFRCFQVNVPALCLVCVPGMLYPDVYTYQLMYIDVGYIPVDILKWSSYLNIYPKFTLNL